MFLNGVRRSGRWLLASLAMLLLASVPAMADNVPIDAFFGTYEGQIVFAGADGVAARDLGVTIRPIDGGFNVTWSTKSRDVPGRMKDKSYSIDFGPTGRANIFQSRMRSNMFGGRVPFDPLKGDPMVWARIVDRTFTVYALHVLDDGSYEMQIYDRTLADGGLDLKFSRYRQGEAVRDIRGFLKRTGS
jgi:hypothetical protein